MKLLIIEDERELSANIVTYLSSCLHAHIKNLKAKLAEAGVRDCIKNVYGTGYKWVEL